MVDTQPHLSGLGILGSISLTPSLVAGSETSSACAAAEDARKGDPPPPWEVMPRPGPRYARAQRHQLQYLQTVDLAIPQLSATEALFFPPMYRFTASALS